MIYQSGARDVSASSLIERDARIAQDGGRDTSVNRNALLALADNDMRNSRNHSIYARMARRPGQQFFGIRYIDDAPASSVTLVPAKKCRGVIAGSVPILTE